MVGASKRVVDGGSDRQTDRQTHGQPASALAGRPGERAGIFHAVGLTINQILDVFRNYPRRKQLDERESWLASGKAHHYHLHCCCCRCCRRDEYILSESGSLLAHSPPSVDRPTRRRRRRPRRRIPRRLRVTTRISERLYIPAAETARKLTRNSNSVIICPEVMCCADTAPPQMKPVDHSANAVDSKKKNHSG